ncbi:MAG: hypothetical protein N3C57_04640 [Aquificaceae bacterium]|nr:hypothetical protein [Aquificaceae bacterium]
MTKEYEIGVNLLKKIHGELERLLEVNDKLTVRRIVNTIIHPITASAYQIRVGNGPNKDEFLHVLIDLVREMRDLSNIEDLKETIKKTIALLKEVEASSTESKEKV